MVTDIGAIDLTASDTDQGIRLEENATILDAATLMFFIMHVLNIFMIYDVNYLLYQYHT